MQGFSLKIWNCDQAGLKLWCSLVSFLILASGLIAWAAEIQVSPPAGPAAKKDSKIRIRADKLVADLAAGQAEFQGNVRVTQGDTVITADKLEIYRNPNSEADETKPLTKDSIQKIVAKGQVRIFFDTATATSDRAEYDLKTETMTLTGRNSKVISGKNSITGSRFVLHRMDGRIKVDGQQKEQVKAVFFSGKQKLK